MCPARTSPVPVWISWCRCRGEIARNAVDLRKIELEHYSSRLRDPRELYLSKYWDSRVIFIFSQIIKFYKVQLKFKKFTTFLAISPRHRHRVVMGPSGTDRNLSAQTDTGPALTCLDRDQSKADMCWSIRSEKESLKVCAGRWRLTPSQTPAQTIRDISALDWSRSKQVKVGPVHVWTGRCRCRGEILRNAVKIKIKIKF